MVIRAARLALAGLSLLALGAGEAPARLPAEDCVRQIREARILSSQGQQDAARRLLWQAVEDYPTEVLPLIDLSLLHRAGTFPDEEEARLWELMRARAADPASTLPFASLVELAEDNDAPRHDLSLLRDAIRARMEASPGDDPRLLEIVALLDERLGEPETARKLLGRLLEIRPSDDLRWRCAELDARLGNWESALALLRVLRGSAPDSSRVRKQMVVALAKTGRTEELEKEVAPLLEGPPERGSHPHAIETLLEAAWALRDAGLDAKAEKAFRLVLQAVPDQKEAKSALLRLYGTAEERAALDAEVAQRWSEEQDPDALLAEASARLAAGDAQAAYDLLRRAAPALPDSEIAWYDLGLAAFKLERWDEAEQALEKAAAINPERVEVLFNLGAAQQKLGRCDRAVETLGRLLEKDPSMTQAHYYLYACYRDMGDAVRAAQELNLYESSKR